MTNTMLHFCKIALVAATASQNLAHEPPKLLLAQERWRCEWSWENESEIHRSYVGVFRSHVELIGVFEGLRDGGRDLLIPQSDHAIAQNDDAAVVFVYSDMGNTDVEGRTRRWATIYILEKRTGEFQKTNVGLGDEPREAMGECNRY